MPAFISVPPREEKRCCASFVPWALDTARADNFDELAGPGDLGYPATIELDGGLLMAVYYQCFQGDAKCSILYTIWKL